MVGNTRTTGPGEKGSIAKRHHYVPRFLLQRFAEESAARPAAMWRLDKRTGSNRRANVQNESVIGHYYRGPADAPARHLPEQVLSTVEGLTAEILGRLAQPGSRVAPDDTEILALFLLLQKMRTPAGRRAIKFHDEVFIRLATEVNLQDKDGFRDAMKASGDYVSDVDCEENRLALLRDFGEGRVHLESTPEREIAGMFMALRPIAKELAEGTYTWTVLRTNTTSSPFILSDSPVALFDPRHDGQGGLGFRSSEETQTTLPLDPSFCLYLHPGPRRFLERLATPDEVAEINLRTYAWADVCVYGNSHASVVNTRIYAEHHPERLHLVRRREGTTWIGQQVEGAPEGVFDFQGYAIDGSVRKRRMFVPKDARRTDPPPADN